MISMSKKLSHTRGQFHVGTCGFQYKHWRDVFYPAGLPTARWLSYYAERFATVELNNTFYRLPSRHVVLGWRERVPRDFIFALKFSRYATHLKRLIQPRPALRRFLGRAQLLGGSLGPILVQLPPRWRADPERLDAFLRAAPREYRWAVEFRDPSWLSETVFAVLARHQAALCVHDILPRHPWELTASWLYVRFHGSGVGRYAGSYGRPALLDYARRIRAYLARGVDVYTYFNNDIHGHAVKDAAELRRYVMRRHASPSRDNGLRR
jgi:uncharacterized protein YecE (DUF72 family)